MKKKSRMPEIGEACFCIIYLLFGFVAAAILLTKAGDREVIRLYGIMTLILAGGDSFHLVPRIIHAFNEKYEKYEFYAGLGLMVSSITMTIFYLVLFKIWGMLGGEASSFTTYGLWVLAILRIVLCLFPQNNWFHKEGNQTWGIYRNIPFAGVGLITIVSFATIGMWNMAIAILISFGCYFPVVLWAKKNPKIGMLMMPKTAAYMWIICIGLGLL